VSFIHIALLACCDAMLLQVRRDAEERQRRDEIEREEKRIAAQKRRDAIVTRIRKQQEAEERRVQEAAAAKLREIESQQRLEQVGWLVAGCSCLPPPCW
jgi:hypothetical protein